MNPDLELFLKTAKPEWGVRLIDGVSANVGGSWLTPENDSHSAKANHLIEQALVEEGYWLGLDTTHEGVTLCAGRREKNGTSTCEFEAVTLPTKALCLVRAWNALHKENLNDPICGL